MTRRRVDGARLPGKLPGKPRGRPPGVGLAGLAASRGSGSAILDDRPVAVAGGDVIPGGEAVAQLLGPLLAVGDLLVAVGLELLGLLLRCRLSATSRLSPGS